MTPMEINAYDPEAFSKPEPKAGEIWMTRWGDIVMITAVGSLDIYRFLPDCLEYVELGAARHDCCGRWWDVDYLTPTAETDAYWTPNGHLRMDRGYFEAWNGRGVFYATADGERAQKLIQRWKKADDWDARTIVEERMKKLFSRQVAQFGSR